MVYASATEDPSAGRGYATSWPASSSLQTPNILYLIRTSQPRGSSWAEIKGLRAKSGQVEPAENVTHAA